MDRARELAPRAGVKDAYLPERLHRLHRTGWIVPLRRGLYALSSTAPGIPDAHEFKIAMFLVSPAAISHWTAMHHHGLTERIPRSIYVLTTTEGSAPRHRNPAAARSRDGYRVRNIHYRFIRTRPNRFFGIERAWAGETRIWITNLERTLLNELIRPRYCGGFAEAPRVFEVGRSYAVERSMKRGCFR